LPLSSCAHRFLLLSAPTGHNASQLSSAEPSPYDRLILDKHVRFIGDPVAIVAGADERCVDKAMKLIKTEYEVLEPLLDFTKAKDNEILVHPEDNWEALCPVGADSLTCTCESFHILVNIFICKYCFYSRHLHRNISINILYKCVGIRC